MKSYYIRQLYVLHVIFTMVSHQVLSMVLRGLHCFCKDWITFFFPFFWVPWSFLSDTVALNIIMYSSSCLWNGYIPVWDTHWKFCTVEQKTVQFWKHETITTSAAMVNAKCECNIDFPQCICALVEDYCTDKVTVKAFEEYLRNYRGIWIMFKHHYPVLNHMVELFGLMFRIFAYSRRPHILTFSLTFPVILNFLDSSVFQAFQAGRHSGDRVGTTWPRDQTKRGLGIVASRIQVAWRNKGYKEWTLRMRTRILQSTDDRIHCQFVVLNYDNSVTVQEDERTTHYT